MQFHNTSHSKVHNASTLSRPVNLQIFGWPIRQLENQICRCALPANST